MDYETIVGLEIHAQLATRSKMFCSCDNRYASAPPNTHVCPVCLGLPGVLPVINRSAVEYTIMTALALNCEIPPFSRFDRKNYPYPDLMKGYQISQYDLPLSQNGWIDIETPEGGAKRVGITRVHLEEDTARLAHVRNEQGETCSLVDVNRAGVPLMEIVSEPDMRSAGEAEAYARKLRTILRYLGVSSGNMEEGSMRLEANVSLRLRGAEKFGTKVEVKNMNSFRALFSALRFETERQSRLLDAGERVVQETRGWDDNLSITVSQRSKEFAHDYRYFPEPDLPPLEVSRAWVSKLQARLPELPDAKRRRFVDELGLRPYDAQILAGSREVADYFEHALAEYPDARTVANWVTGELFRVLNAKGLDITETKISATNLAEMLKLIDQGVLSGRMAKSVFETMFETGRPAMQVVQESGLVQISDEGALEQAVDQAIAGNFQAIADYRAGKKQSVGFLVGQVMKATRGKASPSVVNEILRRRLES